MLRALLLLAKNLCGICCLGFIVIDNIYVFRFDIMAPKTNVHQVIYSVMESIGSKNLECPKSIFHKIRLFKSPAEVALMQKACDITAEAFVDTISCSKPGTKTFIFYVLLHYKI